MNAGPAPVQKQLKRLTKTLCIQRRTSQARICFCFDSLHIDKKYQKLHSHGAEVYKAGKIVSFMYIVRSPPHLFKGGGGGGKFLLTPGKGGGDLKN